jgi:hypothetical protein
VKKKGDNDAEISFEAGRGEWGGGPGHGVPSGVGTSGGPWPATGQREVGTGPQAAGVGGAAT